MTNNTKRLFFTCSLKAAYMAKEFGVVIHGLMESNHKYPLSSRWEDVANFRCGEMYVAKESEHIFDLKESDDILIGGSDFHSIDTKIAEKNKDSQAITLKKAQLCNGEIIMRNNKHFFSGEIENE